MKLAGYSLDAIRGLSDCLKEIPFLQLMEISPSEKENGPDFILQVRIPDRSMTILAECKNSGQPRLARQAAYQIRDWLSNGLGDYGIFVAPYISNQAAAICREADIGYFDLAGNCLLSFETLYIHRDGRPNPRIQRRELRSLYAPKAERILRVLLTQPQQSWKTKTLAETAQVSFGQVSNVRRMLVDREWIAQTESGIRLNNPGAALDEWGRNYRFRRNKTFDYYALAEVSDCEYQLAETCQGEGIRYALTAFSGAARIAPTVKYQRAIAYISGNPDSLEAKLGWKRVESGANVSLLNPYDEGVFFGSSEVDGVWIASPVQIYLDLQEIHGRGQEAAQALRQIIEQSWQ